jgi:hypothetical protein
MPGNEGCPPQISRIDLKALDMIDPSNTKSCTSDNASIFSESTNATKPEKAEKPQNKKELLNQRKHLKHLQSIVRRPMQYCPGTMI